MRIRDGRVACPSRGEVDVEACFSCSHMLNAAGNGDGSIVCEYPVDTVASSDAPPSKI